MDGFREWQAQRQTLDLSPNTFEHHVVAAGSGGTAAGLLAGLCAEGRPGRVVAVAVNHNPTLRSLILAQAVAVSRRADKTRVLRPSRLHVTAETLGAGYGHETADTRTAIAQCEHIGLTLDHTYTAKSLYLRHSSEPHPHRRCRRVLANPVSTLA